MHASSISYRANCLQLLAANDPFEVLVIGGGASGLGIALEACTRGYKVLLVEQSDFAKGTSSRSTKLVHGGVRYLAQGNIKLVREACIERGILRRNAAHLVRDQTFLVPVYSFWERLKYTIGLKLYDRIAGKWRLGASRFISRTETLQRLPAIQSKKLKGSILYHDGQFDDARLAINLAQSIIDNGGQAINYMQVTSLIKNEQGFITGAGLLDKENGRHYRCHARVVVNATGVFVDEVLQMDHPLANRTVQASQGVHLVFDASLFNSTDALMIPKTQDGRVLFAVPWHHKVVIGTTDTPVNQSTLEPVALEKEIDFILQTAAQYFKSPPTRQQVSSIFAGLRPLAASHDARQKTKEISRSHKIIVSPSQLFTILGGKWTTYRKMGEDMLNSIEKNMAWPFSTSITATLPIHGHVKQTNDDDTFYVYGTDAPEQRLHPDPQQWLSTSLHIHAWQVQWAVEHEMARTIEDVLARRTRALFLDAREAIRMAPAVAQLMSQLLNKSEQWAAAQVNAFTTIANNYLLA